MSRATRSNAGFTLVELLAALVITGSLAATAIPTFVDLRLEAMLARNQGVYAAVHSTAQSGHALWMARASGATLNLGGWGSGTADFNAAGWPVGTSMATTGATATLTRAGCAEIIAMIAPSLRVYTGGGAAAGYDYTVAVETDSGVEECAYYPLKDGALMSYGGYYRYFKYYPNTGGAKGAGSIYTHGG